MNTKRKGFTLIELLIVVSIIGILSVALIPNLSGAPARARDAARKAMLSEVAAAIETFQVDTGEYPDFSNASDNTSEVCLDGTDENTAALGAGITNEATFVTDYMKGVAPSAQPYDAYTTCPSNVVYQKLRDGYALYIPLETGRGGEYSQSGLNGLTESNSGSEAEASTAGTDAQAVVR